MLRKILRGMNVLGQLRSRHQIYTMDGYGDLFDDQVEIAHPEVAPEVSNMYCINFCIITHGFDPSRVQIVVVPYKRKTQYKRSFTIVGIEFPELIEVTDDLPS